MSIVPKQSDVWLIVITVIGGVKTTNVADVADPLIHLVFGVSHQIKDAVKGFDVEYVAVLQIFFAEGQTGVHLRESNRHGLA